MPTKEYNPLDYERMRGAVVDGVTYMAAAEVGQRSQGWEIVAEVV
jgi:hypothetical protein